MISQILTQRNARAAYYDTLAGGGISRTAGFSSALRATGGTGQSVYDELSQGTKQQEVQLANQFNSDMVKMGTTINQYVIPALLTMGKDALTAGGAGAGAVEAAKKGADTQIPGGAGTVLAAARFPLSGPIGLMGATMKGIYDQTAGVQQAVGHAVGQVGNLIDAPMRMTAPAAGPIPP